MGRFCFYDKKSLGNLFTYWMWGGKEKEVKEGTKIADLSNLKNCVTIN